MARGISCAVVVFPPAPPVTVVVDGRKLAVYEPARVVDGRIYAPLSLVRAFVDRMWLDGAVLHVERKGRTARIAFTVRFAGLADVSSVALAPLLRALGDGVRYSARTRRLEVTTPPTLPIVSATPFTGVLPAARGVFTPEPVATPRPVWSGSPLPRRTPLPQSSPR